MDFNKLNELKLNYSSITHLKYRLHRNTDALDEKLRSTNQMWFSSDIQYRNFIEITSTVDVCFFNNKVKLNEFMNISFDELSQIVNEDLYNIIKYHSGTADSYYETVSINEKYHRFSINDSCEYALNDELFYPITHKSISECYQMKLKQLYEKDGIVNDFDDYIDDMAYEIMKGYNRFKDIKDELKVFNEYSRYAYYSQYDSSTTPITKHYECDFAEYHQHNGIMDKFWHKIKYKFNYKPDGKGIMGASRKQKNKEPDTVLSLEETEVFYNNDINIVVNTAKSLNLEIVTTELQHELTHVKVIWNNLTKDVTQTRSGKLSNIVIDDNKFKNVTNEQKQYVTMCCYLASSFEDSAFVNAMRRNILFNIRKYRLLVNNGYTDAEKLAYIMVENTQSYNYCNTMKAHFDMLDKINFNNRIGVIAVLLLGYFLRYHNFFWMYSKLLNGKYLPELTEHPEIKIRKREWLMIRDKISTLLHQKYEEHLTECLRQAKKIALSIGAK